MSVTAARGFEASGVAAGIRYKRADVALVRSTSPAVGGAMFTRNKVQAACLQLNRAHLAAAEPQAVVVNSGVANAATGATGYENAVATAAHTAQQLGLAAEQVLVLSTGVIGMQLPMDRLLPGVDSAAGALSADGGPAAADRLIKANVVAVVGPICSAGTNASLSLYDKAGITHISASATAGNPGRANTR